MSFSPDGLTLAADGDGDDGTIRRWNVTEPAHATPIGQPFTDVPQRHYRLLAADGQ